MIVYKISKSTFWWTQLSKEVFYKTLNLRKVSKLAKNKRSQCYKPILELLCKLLLHHSRHCDPHFGFILSVFSSLLFPTRTFLHSYITFTLAAHTFYHLLDTSLMWCLTLPFFHSRPLIWNILISNLKEFVRRVATIHNRTWVVRIEG